MHALIIAGGIPPKKNLLKQERLNDEILYYNQMCGLTWEQAKTKYIGDVGR